MRRALRTPEDWFLDELVAAVNGKRAPGWSENEPITFAIVRQPDPQLHVPVEDRYLRTRAREFLFRSSRTNDPSPHAVLVLCPSQ